MIMHALELQYQAEIEKAKANNHKVYSRNGLERNAETYLLDLDHSSENEKSC